MEHLDVGLEADLLHLAENLLARPGAGTGLQLSVARYGTPVVDLAVGTTIGGEPMATTHLHSGFCITKPLLGLAAALLIERGLVEADTVVSDIIGARSWIPAGVTVAEVLRHDAGLLRPFAFEWRLCPPAQRDEFLTTITNEAGPAYSELAAGLVVEALIALSTRQHPAEFIENELLRPLGVLEDVIVDPSLATSGAVRARVRTPIGGLPDRCIPLLSERVDHQLAETRPAFGGLVSMAGVARVAAAIERILGGHVHPGMPWPDTVAQLVADRPGPRADRSMRRDCEFTLMTQVGLAAHGISELASAAAVGHVAGIANCVMVADPVSGLALAAYLNGSTLGDPHRAAETRRELVDGVIDICTDRSLR